MKMQENPANFPRKGERGSAIIWIFVMIALFGLLSFVMSQGSRTGGNSISTEQAKLAASNVIEYGSAIRRAVHELRINGCSDTQISFEHSSTGSTYENTNAPGSQCYVFHPDGGGLNYTDFQNSSGHGFYGQSALPGVGTTCAGVDCADLYVLVSFENNDASYNTCVEINKALGHNDIPEPLSLDFALGGSPFTGAYGSGLNDDGTVYEGKQMGCYQWAGADSRYLYYQTLIAR